MSSNVVKWCYGKAFKCATNQSGAAVLRGIYECSTVKGGSEVKEVECEEISSVQWQSASEGEVKYSAKYMKVLRCHVRVELACLLGYVPGILCASSVYCVFIAVTLCIMYQFLLEAGLFSFV